MKRASGVSGISVADAIKQTLPFAYQIVEMLRRLDARLMAPAGITPQQYNVLRILRGARGPLLTYEVAKRLLEQTPGITRLLDRIEERGWIRRARSNEDRRQVLVEITQSGLALLSELDTTVDASDAAQFSSLDDEQLTQLIRILELLRADLSERL
jgi:DNA-binding MarR family transcriptional regulator